MFNAAFDAITAANIDIIMNTHLIAGQPQGTGNLVGIFWHLHRCPYIKHLLPRIPFGNNAECFNRDGRIASPGDAKTQLVISRGKIIIHRPPDKFFIKQNIAVVIWMHLWAVITQGLFWIQHKWQGCCFEANFFNRVFGDGPAFGNHRTYPFTGIPHLSNGKRVASDIGGVQTVHQWVNCGGKFGPGHNINDAGHGQRGAGINRVNAGGRQVAWHQRDMRHIGMIIIGNIMAFAGNKAAVFDDPARL